MECKKFATIEAVIIIALIVSFPAYTMSTQPQTITISGAGATFPQPLIQKWSEEFYDLTGVQVEYEGIGSGGGIRQFINKTVDFGATDIPMSDEEFAQAPGVLHIPETIGGVVIVYNIPNIDSGLNFTGEILAQIFGRNITKWNDPQLVAINPGVTLPDKEIVVVHRSDSSGTTGIFTAFLADESEFWANNFGAGKIINWPKDTLGGKGNPGVAALVQQNDYSIGYVELSYALNSQPPLTYGRVQNAAGEFVEPSFETLKQAAAVSISVLPRGNESWASVGNYFNLHKVENATGAYPITSFSYIIVYRELSVVPGMTLEKAKALTWFLWWIIHDGQHYAPLLSYVPLPDVVVKLNEETLRMITFNGEQVNDWT
ncbi:MAG: phosphate ABC transporter substrate-binding protein PstS [Candidatus Asgardarchaeia archaeon]